MVEVSPAKPGEFSEARLRIGPCLLSQNPWHDNSMDELAKKDLVEGPKALKRFNSLVRKVMSVPREEILRRDAEWRRNLRGKKRGPKPKQSSSPDPDVAPPA
jgi:hypothetical protein